jgi:hypothetical protein
MKLSIDLSWSFVNRMVVVIMHWHSSGRNDNEGLNVGFHGLIDIWNKKNA